MKPLLCALYVAFGFCGMSAQTPVWQPSPGHTQVPIWPGAVPDAQPAAAPESEGGTDPRISSRVGRGFPWQSVAAHDDGLFAERKKYGCRGGGVSRRRLSDSGHRSRRHGGLRLADLQRNHVRAAEVPRAGFGSGIGTTNVNATFIRKHPRRWKMRSGHWGSCAFTPPSGISIRTRSECWGFRRADIWWRKISTHFERRAYAPVDAADKVSCRPDFAVAIYPGHMWIHDERIRIESGYSHSYHPPDPAYVFAAGRGRQRGRRKAIAGLLHWAEERWRSRGDAFVRAWRPCVRAAAHGASDHAMARAGGDVAGDDRNDSEANPSLIGAQAVCSSHLSLMP